jgi:hypothetical protein
MPNSFAGDYRLCDGCLERIEVAGGVHQKFEAWKRREAYVVVFAKAYAWLKELNEREVWPKITSSK